MMLLLMLSLTAGAAPDTLTLVKAVEWGRLRAAQATIARLGAKAADIRVGQRRADLLPNLSGSATATRQTLNLDEFGFPGAGGVTNPFSIFNFRLRIQQTIYDPATFARLAATRDSVVAAGLDAETAGVVAGTAAGIAFLRAVSAEETVAARESDTTTTYRLLIGARQVNQAGLTPAIDVTRSEVTFATARTQLALARNLRDRTRLDLIRALDFPADTTVTLAHDLSGTTAGVPATAAEAARFARQHRSDLGAERQRLRVMETGREAIRAENLPSVTATGALTESGRKTGTLKSTYLAQLGISIPILDGWRRQLRSREQGLRIDAQAARVTDLEHQIDIETRQAFLDLASAIDQVALAQERATLADRELSQAEERLHAGVAGTLETTTAQGGVTAAQDGIIQARVAQSVARIGLYRALGILEQLR